jgi:uncharacterized protein YndB with AHSA1/START domain
MKMTKKISHKIRIKAPRENVFKALSTAQGLKGWYTPHLQGDIAEGREAVFSFTGREPFRWRFTEMSPQSQVRWECVEGPGAAGGTTVTFRVSNTDGGRTVVECEHEGWSDSDEAFTICNTLWGILMGHLMDYAETAKPDPAFK